MNPTPETPLIGDPSHSPSKQSMRDSDIPDLIILKKRKVEIEAQLKDSKRKWKAQASFDLKFWTQAVEVEDLEIKSSQLKRKISLRASGISEAQWTNTTEAQQIFEQIEASEQYKKICRRQIAELGQKARSRSLRASFMKLFTTSKMGIGVLTTGAGKRNSSEQSEFRKGLIQAYEAKHSEQNWLWCPIMGDYLDPKDMVAAHLFSWKHGQDTMDAIFGKQKEAELFSPCNGILLSRQIEDSFDIGKLAIVPWVPESDDSKIEIIRRWLANEKREYKVKILDPKWDRLESPISRYYQLKFKDLDGRKLSFIGSFRPAARYLYFHYCIQLLRRAWQHNEAKSAAKAAGLLREENGKPFWGTPGRYLPKNMLLAIVEELGYEYKALLDGAGRNQSGDSDLLLGIATAQVKFRRPAIDGIFQRSDSSDSEETEEES
ncbi:hypothetical protein N7462_007410 [Penicillium macrosclerotiorum]|uniref:uncharacterized protein n=1 Tax=Penicillium macrosclerotiorum TaxID=303699 RepID=UPI002548FA3B|nr:uncharacterized protein N7462_007410 [Penicillium macrosclerotiorum]KAJ5679166.1 hypothetical protein N7462_007410 [Penicillium macrosclerotiorum]